MCGHHPCVLEESKEGFMGKVAFGLGLSRYRGVLGLFSKLLALCLSPTLYLTKLFVQNLSLFSPGSGVDSEEPIEQIYPRNHANILEN